MYPTFMHEGKGFSQSMASKATMIAKSGAVVGGTIMGYYSQFLGRRLTIIIACVCGACLIPLWVLPSSWGTLTAGAFLLQFMVQGAWGVVPVHLQELAPPAFRSSFPGICYQLGNMISAPAAQIDAALAEGNPTMVNGKMVPSYGMTQAGMMSIIFVFLAIWAAVGNEQLGSRFELAAAAGDNEASQKEGLEKAVESGESVSNLGKENSVEMVEKTQSAEGKL